MSTDLLRNGTTLKINRLEWEIYGNTDKFYRLQHMEEKDGKRVQKLWTLLQFDQVEALVKTQLEASSAQLAAQPIPS